jgi:hypothetical protein
VFTEVAPKVHDCERGVGGFAELAADFQRIVRTSVVHEYELQSARDVEPGKSLNEKADAFGAVVYRDYN